MRALVVLLLLALVQCLCLVHDANGQTLYGGNGGHNNGDSINDGALVTVDQTNAAIAVVGQPPGVARLTGIAFDDSGALFGSTIDSGGFPPPPPPQTSTLVRLDPETGALLATIGPIRDGINGPSMSISDITVQPGSGVLFGIRGPNDGLNRQGRLYTIDKTTGVATLVGNTGAFVATIAFAPDGTLYESAAFLGPSGPSNPTWRTVNPANGVPLTSVTTANFYGALAVRPTDGVIFGGTGDLHEVFRVSAGSGGGTRIGDTGRNFVGAFAFRTLSGGACVPDATTLCLNGGRFRVQASFRTPQGATGVGRAIGLTADTGYFWFFDSANIEIVVKALNACGINQRHWVFAAGLTDVEVTLTVVDSQTSNVKTYVNPLNTAFVPVQDTSAFSTCP